MMPDESLKIDLWEKVYRKNHDVVTRKIAGELFLVPIKGKIADMQRIFTLNPVGEFIWQELDAQKSLNDICDDLISNFDVKKETAMADIKEFVTELLQADLIMEKS
jgi:hypothetical protein